VRLARGCAEPHCLERPLFRRERRRRALVFRYT